MNTHFLATLIAVLASTQTVAAATTTTDADYFTYTPTAGARRLSTLAPKQGHHAHNKAYHPAGAPKPTTFDTKAEKNTKNNPNVKAVAPESISVSPVETSTPTTTLAATTSTTTPAAVAATTEAAVAATTEATHGTTAITSAGSTFIAVTSGSGISSVATVTSVTPIVTRIAGVVTTSYSSSLYTTTITDSAGMAVVDSVGTYYYMMELD